MEFKQEILKDTFAIKITAQEDGKVVGRCLLYILKNELHKEPFGLLEDVFVEESHRNHGLGSQLVQRAVDEAKAQGCYKLIATSRNSKPELQKFYAKFGLEVWGVEYRVNF